MVSLLIAMVCFIQMFEYLSCQSPLKIISEDININYKYKYEYKQDQNRVKMARLQ